MNSWRTTGGRLAVLRRERVGHLVDRLARSARRSPGTRSRGSRRCSARRRRPRTGARSRRSRPGGRRRRRGPRRSQRYQTSAASSPISSTSTTTQHHRGPATGRDPLGGRCAGAARPGRPSRAAAPVGVGLGGAAGVGRLLVRWCGCRLLEPLASAALATRPATLRGRPVGLRDPTTGRLGGRDAGEPSAQLTNWRSSVSHSPSSRTRSRRRRKLRATGLLSVDCVGDGARGRGEHGGAVLVDVRRRPPRAPRPPSPTSPA